MTYRTQNIIGGLVIAAIFLLNALAR